jgi:periplasmic protein TonB
MFNALSTPGVMSSSNSTTSQRRGLLFAALAAVVIIVGGGFWYAHAAMNAKPTGHTANDGSDVGIMMGLAETAYQQKNLVAPVGSNVYEFYFSVLQLDPDNAIAQQRMRDAFKPACDIVESTINSGNLDEAQRELSLLRMYDPHNYKLALLGGVLDAQRVIERREHEAEAARIQSQQAAGGQSSNWVYPAR